MAREILQAEYVNFINIKRQIEENRDKCSGIPYEDVVNFLFSRAKVKWFNFVNSLVIKS